MAGVIIGIVGSLVAIVVAIFVPLDIERRKRPSFAFECRDSTCLNDVKYLHVAVINRPLKGRWLLRNTATGCQASVNFEPFPIGDGNLGPWSKTARWSAKAEPWAIFVENGVVKRVYDDTKLDNCFHMDLEPSDRGEVIIAAIKHVADREAYVLSTASYGGTSDGALRSPGLILPDRDYKLTVVVEAGGLTCSADFRVYNGDGHDGFRIEEWPSTLTGEQRAV